MFFILVATPINPLTKIFLSVVVFLVFAATFCPGFGAAPFSFELLFGLFDLFFVNPIYL